MFACFCRYLQSRFANRVATRRADAVYAHSRESFANRSNSVSHGTWRCEHNGLQAHLGGKRLHTFLVRQRAVGYWIIDFESQSLKAFFQCSSGKFTARVKHTSFSPVQAGKGFNQALHVLAFRDKINSVACALCLLRCYVPHTGDSIRPRLLGRTHCVYTRKNKPVVFAPVRLLEHGISGRSNSYQRKMKHPRAVLGEKLCQFAGLFARDGDDQSIQLSRGFVTHLDRYNSSGIARERPMRLIKTTPLLLLLFLAACGSMEVKNVQSQADLFMERLTKGDFNGAYELCDADAVSLDNLQNIGNNSEYDTVLNNFKGFKHDEGAQAKKDADGRIIELRLAPAHFKGHEDWVAHFAFRKENDNWLIIGFKIESPKK